MKHHFPIVKNQTPSHPNNGSPMSTDLSIEAHHYGCGIVALSGIVTLKLFLKLSKSTRTRDLLLCNEPYAPVELPRPNVAAPTSLSAPKSTARQAPLHASPARFAYPILASASPFRKIGVARTVASSGSVRSGCCSILARE